MRDIDEIHIPGAGGLSVDCPMARTATGHYLRQIAITKRRQVVGTETPVRRRPRSEALITHWKR